MKELGPLPTVVCRLSVGEAKVSDTGLWICELSNAAGKSTSTCNVKVVDTVSDTTNTPPCFEKPLSNMTVTEFSDAVLKCKAVGKPEPDVKWFHNEVPVDPSFRHDITLDAEGYQTLTIRDVRSRDKGIYKIKVTNAAGWATCDAKLSILKKAEEVPQNKGKKSEYSLVDTIKGRSADQTMLNEADTLLSALSDSATLKKFLIKWKLDDKSLEFPVHLRNKCQVEGSQAVLTCLVNGIPPFNVRWYKGNNEIFDGPKYFIRGNLNILSLEIPITDLKDTDHYMCVVRNEQGKIFTSCYLQIEPRLESLTAELPVKPFFTKPMKKQTVDEGDLAIFRVAAKAHPPPGFKWFKDGQEIHENARINIETLQNGVAQLTIHMVTARDIGLYVCEAHNHAGRARSMVRLRVRDEYEAAMEPARMSVDDKTVSTECVSETGGQQNGDLPHTEPPYEPHVEGEAYSKAPVLNAALPKTVEIRDRGRFLLECSVSGFPKPKVKWLRNEKLLQEDEHTHFLSVSHWYGLEVLDASPKDEGLYTVLVENSSGSVTSSSKVEMKLPKEDSKFFQTSEEELDVFQRPVIQLLQTEFPWHQFDLPGITPSFHLCNYEVDRTENIIKESVCLVDTLETPQFTKPLPDIVTPYEQDTDLRLECEVGGKPCPHVIWFKDNKQLEDSDCLSINWDPESRLAVLTLKVVKLGDSGKYTCVAYSDTGGHAVTASDLQVRGLDYPDKEQEKVSTKRTLPEFKVRLADKEAAPGEEVRLEVKAEGFPAPEVRWFKNSEPVSAETDKYTITSNVEGVHSLVIPEIHLSDSDCFKCEAKNEYGAVLTCAHVKVLAHSDRDNGDKMRPYFEEPLHSISVPTGQDAVFRCIAKGNPLPAFKWLRQGLSNIDQERVKVEVSNGETTLTLKNINSHDAGIYYCFANNKDGTVKSCATLTVLTKNGAAADIKKTSDETKKKEHTLYTEKDFNEAAEEKTLKAATEDIADTAKENIETAKPDESKSDAQESQQATTINQDSNELVELKEMKLEEESAEEISAITEDLINKSNNNAPVEQKAEKPADNTPQASEKEQKAENVDTEKHTEKEQQSENSESGAVIEIPAKDIAAPNNKSVEEKLVSSQNESDSIDSSSKDKGEERLSEMDGGNKMSADQIEDCKNEEQISIITEKSESTENPHSEAESDTINENRKNPTEAQDTVNKASGVAIPDTICDNSLEFKKPLTTKLPRFISHPRSQWVAPNSTLQFIFTAEKCENLTVAWYKDGEILKDDRFQMIWE